MSIRKPMCDCLGCAVGADCIARMQAVIDQAERETHPCGCRKGIEGCFSPLHPEEDEHVSCVHSPAHTLLAPAPTTAQERFDAQYISSLEIGERLGVSRPAVMHARRRGILPEPVCVNDGQIYIWERSEVEPYLRAWEVSVKMRRGEQVIIPAGQAQANLMGVPFLEPKRMDE